MICPGPLWNAGWHYQWEGDWAAPAPSMRLQAHPGGPSLTAAADKGGGFTVAADIGCRWKTPADRDEAAALWEHAIGEGAASRHDTAAEAESDAARRRAAGGDGTRVRHRARSASRRSEQASPHRRSGDAEEAQRLAAVVGGARSGIRFRRHLFPGRAGAWCGGQ